ncbi:MAG TPA: NAD(P)(+) transhydrogenase (Re/Si-specific) subunit alpha, partial [Dongiaceae bacterium]|nr:NAD(P)(+) transhydrogenase (Re/Si-specific) subunit alpha [Dongiaceae bacterium]
MKIGVVKERRPHERRCAVSPDSVKKYVSLGAEVLIESGAGAGSSVPDAAFEAAGAKIVPDARAALSDADVVLKVQRPMTAAEGADELGLMKRGALLAAILNPYGAKDAIASYAQAGIVACAMELVPRITRAQSMDVLSSQSNLAGYKAVLDAAAEYGRAFPMMMTA